MSPDVNGDGRQEQRFRGIHLEPFGIRRPALSNPNNKRITAMIAPYREDLIVPADYHTARPNLIPVIRERWQVVPAITSPAGLPHVAVGEHLAVVVAYNSRHRLVPIDHDTLTAWGVSIGEVIQQAIMSAGSPGAAFERLTGSGRAYRVSGGPGAVAAILQIPSLLSEIAISGMRLVMPAHPECLYVTGDQDTPGQRAVLRAAEESAGRRHSLVGHSLRLEEGGWSPWLPGRSHYLYVGYQTLAAHAAWQRYEAQNEALVEGRYDSHPPGECFVSSLMPIRDPATGAPQSAATWSKGVRCLLPRTDVIAFVEPKLSDNKALIYGLVPWGTAAAVMGDMLEPQGVYPERYLVKGFPSDEQMAAMAPVLDPGRSAGSRG